MDLENTVERMLNSERRSQGIFSERRRHLKCKQEVFCHQRTKRSSRQRLQPRQRQEGVGMPGTFCKLLEVQSGEDRGFPGKENRLKRKYLV